MSVIGNETMKLPQSGGCQCGAIRYEITGPPAAVYACHCTECQKQSGSAFAMAAVNFVLDFRSLGLICLVAGSAPRLAC